MAGDLTEIAQTAGVAGAGGLTIIGVVTWFLKTLREQRSANRDERAAGTIEAGTTAIVDQLNREVTRLTGEVEKLVNRNETLTAAERDTAIENAKLSAKISELRDDLTAEKERSAKLEARLSGIEAKLSKRMTDRPEMGVTLRRFDDE